MNTPIHQYATPSPETPESSLDFSRRAHLSEWMDEPSSYEDFRDCLKDLAQVNRLTLAYRPTFHWLQQFAAVSRPLHVVDVGCGGGDMLRRIERWAAARKLGWSFTGIDLNPYAARAARGFTPLRSRIEWVTGDAFSWQPDRPIDLVVSSLFTHHLPEEEIPRFLAWMESRATAGWFINDLHRDRVPYHLFQWLAFAMRWHRFVQHDGPVSIRRAFQPGDWRRYCDEAGIPASAVPLQTMRPARLCVSRVKPLA